MGQQGNGKVAPKRYLGVMVSSTFTDLEQHRAKLMSVIDRAGLKNVVMENDAAKVMDVLESSLSMVRDSAAYIGVIGHRYGQIPESTEHNAQELSITELEYDEAIRQDRAILLFMMGDEHAVRPRDVETDPAKIEKLQAFREKAKRKRPDSPLHRIYVVFNSLEEFSEKAQQSVAELRRYLDQQHDDRTPQEPPSETKHEAREEEIPTAPALYAEPSYIGSHAFLGRQAELDVLDDWAREADPHPVLLFEAIGGTGKSLLTWYWLNHRAPLRRPEWAGRFWYSFYERGADMSDFCRRAMAYMTGQPFKSFEGMRTAQLRRDLVAELHKRPWLIVLDGLERVLVAYHSLYAAEMLDEEADMPTDKIAERNPRTAIQPEDDELLHSLAGAAPSKILISSRLIPKVLLNTANQAIPGIKSQQLAGLRPADAETLIRDCGVRGDSAAIQDFLQRHCNCHPLVTGVMAGLILEYLPDRGNFDAWTADPERGAPSNLFQLNLVQKRNHILTIAFESLRPESRQLLETLGLVSESIDYGTLCALNPALSDPPGTFESWVEEHTDSSLSEEDLHKEYDHIVADWYAAASAGPALSALDLSVRDLEKKGLLQYDLQTQRYDLHPVVRGVAVAELDSGQAERFGQRVVDHFNQQDRAFLVGRAKSLEQMRPAMEVVRTLLKIGRREEAAEVYWFRLSPSFNDLGARGQQWALLQGFFLRNWVELPKGVPQSRGAYLLIDAAIILSRRGEKSQAIEAYEAAIHAYVNEGNLVGLAGAISGVASRVGLVARERLLGLAERIEPDGAVSDFRKFMFFCSVGKLDEASSLCKKIYDQSVYYKSRVFLYQYPLGSFEYSRALLLLQLGELSEPEIAIAEAAASPNILLEVYRMSGHWYAGQGCWAYARQVFAKAVALAREQGLVNSSEVDLDTARAHLGELGNGEQVGLEHEKNYADAPRELADFWLAIGNKAKAVPHALAAYRLAWDGGEPYVYRYRLNRARLLLEKLGESIPDLPPYNPADHHPFDWETDINRFIDEYIEGQKSARR
jgi:tetratricopeptide (TPR) repeat protein